MSSEAEELRLKILLSLIKEGLENGCTFGYPPKETTEG